MSQRLQDLSLEALTQVVIEARGCGCCATYPDDDCPADPDPDVIYPYVDHTYNTGCGHDFQTLLNLLIEKARKDQ